jgi:hypothetical protein
MSNSMSLTVNGSAYRLENPSQSLASFLRNTVGDKARGAMLAHIGGKTVNQPRRARK